MINPTYFESANESKIYFCKAFQTFCRLKATEMLAALLVPAMSEAYFRTAAAEYGLQVWLRRGQGLPCAGHSWFQTVPAGSKRPTVVHS